MRRSIFVLVFAMACSSSVAQDFPTGISKPVEIVSQQTNPPKIELSALPVVTQPPEVLPPRKSTRNSRLECEWFTKVCVSEGSYNIEEAKRLLQTLENMRDMRADKSLLAAMYAQSAKITRRDPFTDARQIWVSYLPMHGDGPPEKGWIECIGKDPITKTPTPKGCTGNWNSMVKQWVSFRDQAHELYYSGIVPNSVPGKPIQWGGDMDYWRGVDRGFCPLNVGNARLNTYWGDPKDPENEGKCLPIDKDRVVTSKLITASIASGRSRRLVKIHELLSPDDNPKKVFLTENSGELSSKSCLGENCGGYE
jgi:hypothetical protein